jgi:hypothetical protein
MSVFAGVSSYGDRTTSEIVVNALASANWRTALGIESAGTKTGDATVSRPGRRGYWSSRETCVSRAHIRTSEMEDR